MAIESINTNKPTGLLPNKPAAKPSIDGTDKASNPVAEDTVSLTATAKDIQAAVGQKTEVPINEQRVAQIKAAIQAGEFPFNPERIAQKLLDLDLQLPDTT